MEVGRGRFRLHGKRALSTPEKLKSEFIVNALKQFQFFICPEISICLDFFLTSYVYAEISGLILAGPIFITISSNFSRGTAARFRALVR